MEVCYEGQKLDLPGGSAIAVGTFDGVHVGHRALLAETCRQAEELGTRSVIAIFDRHPASIVRPDTAPRLLTGLHRRIELLAETGVELCYVIRFDEERSLQAPEDFVREVLVDALSARALIVGDDFHFGLQRRGDTAVLTDLQSLYDFKIVGMNLVGVPGRPGRVSSTAIRTALGEGDVGDAATMLGRPHEVGGVVVHGDHRGRTIGFPTANVAVPGDMCLPADGVYAGYYQRPDGHVRPAAINLGKRPTFYDDNGLRLLEAHLLDFDGDLYGERANVRFSWRLRGEVRFPSVEELVEQLTRDVAAARQTLLN